MRYWLAYPESGRASKLLAVFLLASVSSACSSGVSRFSENPFTNPFQARYDNTPTGSIRGAASQKVASAQTAASYRQSATTASSRITSVPLPAPGSSQAKALAASAASSSAGKVIEAKAVPGWSAAGGTSITLGAGETAATVANRYGVPASALLAANGVSNSSQLVPGQKLVIPAYNAASGSAGVSGAAKDAATGATNRAMGGAVKKITPSLSSKSLTMLKPDPFKIQFAKTYLALSDVETLEASEALQPSSVLAFTESEVVAKPLPKVKPVVGKTSAGSGSVKHVRAVSSIAAPISIKPAPQIGTAKPVAPASKTVVAAAPKKIVQAAPKLAAKPLVAAAAPRKLAASPAPAAVNVAKKPVIVAAAPKKPVIRTVAAKSTMDKPVQVASQKPLKQVAHAPETTGKIKPPASVKRTASAKAKPAVLAAAVTTGAAVKSAKPESKEIDAHKLDPATPASDHLSTGSLPPVVENNDDKGLFRWPVRGRVISSYGSKDVAGTNNGINISVPEGTPVKAAEAGTIAYSGDDVKKFGKLVLIRHENGYVSAYAHNGELNVKKGDLVKRGQIIAKSGSTGDVASPQLHFQLRKGEQPVDPAKLLDAG